eukprot:689690-Prymnesium_polylepis.1
MIAWRFDRRGSRLHSTSMHVSGCRARRSARGSHSTFRSTESAAGRWTGRSGVRLKTRCCVRRSQRRTCRRLAQTSRR